MQSRRESVKEVHVIQYLWDRWGAVMSKLKVGFGCWAGMKMRGERGGSGCGDDETR